MTSLLSSHLLQSPPSAQVLLCSPQAKTLDFTAGPLSSGLSPTALTSAVLGSPQLCSAHCLLQPEVQEVQTALPDPGNSARPPHPHPTRLTCLLLPFSTADSLVLSGVLRPHSSLSQLLTSHPATRSPEKARSRDLSSAAGPTSTKTLSRAAAASLPLRGSSVFPRFNVDPPLPWLAILSPHSFAGPSVPSLHTSPS